MSFLLNFLTPRGAGRRPAGPSTPERTPRGAGRRPAGPSTPERTPRDAGRRPAGPSTPERPPAKRQFNGPSPARPLATSPPEPFPPVAQRQDEELNTQQSNHSSEGDPSLTRNTSSPATAAGTFLRTPEVVAEGRTKSWNGLDMPEGLPLGPENSLKGLKDRIETWAKEQGFSLSKQDTTPANKSRGQRLSFACHRYGRPRKNQNRNQIDMSRPTQTTTKTDCKWSIWVEESTEGWMVAMLPRGALSEATTKGTGTAPVHNHELPKTQTERNQFHTLREIPEHLRQYAEILAKAGTAFSDIFRFLVSEWDDENANEDPPFTLKDVQNMFQGTRFERAFDATNLIKYLRQRKENDAELDYDFTTDSNGAIDKVLFIAKGAKELWQQCEWSVALFDTKHGTNRYGLKVACLTTVDKNGKTRVLATSLLLHEDEDSFTWVFELFVRLFGNAPSVLFTDEDRAMGLAIRAALPTTEHLLCIFHIWKNFWKHIRPLLLGRTLEWKEASKIFWKLGKNSDSSGQQTFDTQFKALVNVVRGTESAPPTTTTKAMKNGLAWLENLKKRKEQWAACFTWQHVTFGVHSTQRAEAIHSAIAQFCYKGSTIDKLARDMDQMTNQQRIKSESAALDYAFGALLGPSPVISPSADTIGENLGNYPLQLNNAQASQLVMYSVEAVDIEEANTVSSEEQPFLVSRLTNQSDVELDGALEDQDRRRDLERAADHINDSGSTAVESLNADRSNTSC
jgi:hypothetical protein